jgi:hypothetical protein
MDVRLPSGVVVQNVPDGISRADLAAKLKSNGMDVPDAWMSPDARGAPSMTEAPPEAPSLRDRLHDTVSGWFGGKTAAEERTAIQGARASNAVAMGAGRGEGSPSYDEAQETARKAVGGMSQVPQAAAEGAIDSATLGLVRPTVPIETHSALAGVAKGAGSLAGFIAGPAKIAGWLGEATGVAGKLAPTAADGFVKALALDAGGQALTLGVASGLQAGGTAALDSHSLAQGAKTVGEAIKGGVITGGLFGTAGRLLPGQFNPSDPKLAEFAKFMARFVGVSTANDLINGTRPDDNRPAEQKAFDYLQNLWFTRAGAQKPAAEVKPPPGAPQAPGAPPPVSSFAPVNELNAAAGRDVTPGAPTPEPPTAPAVEAAAATVDPEQQKAAATQALATAQTVDQMIKAATDLATPPARPEPPARPALDTPDYAAHDQARLEKLREAIDAHAEVNAADLAASGQPPKMAPKAEKAPEPHWVDTTPIKDVDEARDNLAKLRERAPEFGVNPNDMVLASHPTVDGAWAVRTVPGREPATIQGPQAAPVRDMKGPASKTIGVDRSFADRQADLTGQSNTAGTEFDRQNAATQAQTGRDLRPQRTDSASRLYPDGLTPLNPRQAMQRLSVLRGERDVVPGPDPAALQAQGLKARRDAVRADAAGDPARAQVLRENARYFDDQAALAAKQKATAGPVAEPGRYVAVPHPTVPGAFVIRDTGAMIRGEHVPEAPAPAGPLDQQRLGEASVAGDFHQGRQDLPALMEQQGFKRAQQAVERRGGLATREEAAILDKASPKERLYDRIEGEATPVAETRRGAQAEGMADAKSQLIARRMGLDDGSPTPGTKAIEVPTGYRARDPERLERVRNSEELTPTRPYTPLKSELGAGGPKHGEPLDASGLHSDGGLTLLPTTAYHKLYEQHHAEAQAGEQTAAQVAREAPRREPGAEKPAPEPVSERQPGVPREPHPDEYNGREVSVPVHVEETGETAHLTVDARKALDDLDKRADVLEETLNCVLK